MDSRNSLHWYLYFKHHACEFSPTLPRLYRCNHAAWYAHNRSLHPKFGESLAFLRLDCFVHATGKHNIQTHAFKILFTIHGIIKRFRNTGMSYMAKRISRDTEFVPIPLMKTSHVFLDGPFHYFKQPACEFSTALPRLYRCNYAAWYPQNRSLHPISGEYLAFLRLDWIVHSLEYTNTFVQNSLYDS